MAGGQQFGAHYRGQGQGDDARYQYRSGEGQGEFLEQRASQAVHQTDGHVHRGQGDGHGNHRRRDFPRADQGGLQRREAALDVAVNVFGDHNRIVHHQPDGQHHRQQCEQVDAEAEQRHQCQCAEHRQRDAEDRNQHRAPRAQAQEDDHHHDQNRLEQGFDHFQDRGFDKVRGLEGQRHFDTGRQGFLDVGQQAFDACDDQQRVAFGGGV